MKFKEAYELPIGGHVEKKGKFSYLSWPYAVKFLRENFPQATWVVRDFEGAPYKSTPAGCFVEVSIILDNMKFSQIHPVLNHQNKSVKAPDAFQINTSIQRCLAKAIGIATGIGLGLYAGEDLPVIEKEILYINDKQQKAIKDGLANLDSTDNDIDKFLEWLHASNFGEINISDYDKAIDFINKKLEGVGK